MVEFLCFIKRQKKCFYFLMINRLFSFMSKIVAVLLPRRLMLN